VGGFSFLGIIKPKKKEKKLVRSFRLPQELDRRLSEIALENNQSKTNVLEDLLSYAIKKYDEEKSGK